MIRDPKEIFARDAETAPDRKRFNRSCKPGEADEVFFATAGLKFRAKSNSALLNAFLARIDAFLNDDTLIPDYDPGRSYRKGAAVRYNGRPVLITENISPGGIDGNFLSFNREDLPNSPPKYPACSVDMLEDRFFKGENGKIVPRDLSALPNIKFVKENTLNLVRDFLSDPDVGAHRNDDSKTQFFDEGFFRRTEDDYNAFDFNFPKKLVFCFGSDETFGIAKNIFKCFPERAKIKITPGADDGVPNWQERNTLLEAFERGEFFLFVARTMHITQIRGDLYLIEYAGRSIQRSRAFIVPPGEDGVARIIAVNNSYGFAAIGDGGNPSRDIAEGAAREIRAEDGESKYAVEGLSEKLETFGPYVMRLEIDLYTYLFVPNGNGTLRVIRYDQLRLRLRLLQSEMPIDKRMTADLSEGDSLRILKNYGQFAENKHRVVRRDLRGGKQICYLRQNPNGTFEAEEVLSPDDPATALAGEVQYFDPAERKLHVFFISPSLTETPGGQMFEAPWGTYGKYSRFARVFFRMTDRFNLKVTEKIISFPSKEINIRKFEGSTEARGTAMIFTRQGLPHMSPREGKPPAVNRYLISVTGDSASILCFGRSSFFHFRLRGDSLTDLTVLIGDAGDWKTEPQEGGPPAGFAVNRVVASGNPDGGAWNFSFTLDELEIAFRTDQIAWGNKWNGDYGSEPLSFPSDIRYFVTVEGKQACQLPKNFLIARGGVFDKWF